MIIKPRCPSCNKLVEVERESILGNLIAYKYVCGHTEFKPYVKVNKSELDIFLDNFTSVDGTKKLRQYQKEGIKFGIKANARVLIGDEMGLGKTLQDMLIMHYLDLYPALVICKAGLREQIAHEYIYWIGTDKAIPNVINEPRFERPYPDILKLTIISFDSLQRCDWIEDEEFIKQFKCVIIDETQQIKNDEAKRTVAVKKVVQYIPHIIGSSGTAIKNNMAEYFSILNILKPELFSNKKQFTYRFVDTRSNGKGYGGILPMMEDTFKSMTEDFIIRRTRAEVAPDLPTVDRQYLFYPLGEQVEAAYQKIMEAFMDDYLEKGDQPQTSMELLGYMAKMRHLTGVAKVIPVVEYVEEFLLTTNKKIVIFTHHNDVAELLMMKLSKACEDGAFDMPLNLVGLMPTERWPIIEKFRKEDSCRILIASTIASGEGLNLQFCDHCIIMEREWNPANEEQAEARFTRLGSTAEKVVAMYPVAIETIDEFLASMVEEKRAYMSQVLDGKNFDWKESDLMKELADKLYKLGVKKYRLPRG